MNKFVKKVLVGFAAITVSITYFGSAFAAPTLLHQDKKTTVLSSGVVHESIKQFHADGWWNINVLRVNLDDEYTKIDTVYNEKGIAGTNTLTNMISGTNAVGAVNGDFFSMGKPSFPLGVTVSDGKVVSSPKYGSGSPVFSIDNNKNALMSYLNWKMHLVAPNGKPMEVVSINKDSGSQSHAIVFNDSWGGQTHNGVSKDVVDMIVKDGIVTEIRVGLAPIYVSKGTTVIHAKGAAKNFIVNNFSVGATAELKSVGSVDLNNMSTAVAGGAWLLQNGVASTNYDIKSPGNQPRTAIGLTRDKKQVIMLTIDGRDKIFSGVTLPVLTNIMKSLGAHDALNLDGGGSTVMAVKTREDEKAKVVNILSQGSQRKISNGLAVFDSAPIGEVSRLELSTLDNNIFNNSSRTIDIVGYDDYQHKIKVNPKDVEFTVEGTEGTFDANKFTPTSAGKATIKASLNGVMGQMDLNVLSDLKEIIFSTSKIGVGISATHNLGEIYGIDSRGLKIKMDNPAIDWEVIGDIGQISNGVFYATDKPASGAIVARLNGAVKIIPVSIGLENKAISNLDSLNGITTSSFPKNLVGGTVSLDSDSKVGASSLKINYDFTKTDKTRAFYTVLGQGMKINGNPSSIGLWINGNSDKTWVRGTLIDANNKEYKLDFADSVDWTGWKNVEAKIPTGVAYPVTLRNIYVAQIDPNNKALGSIKINAISGLYTKDVVLDPSTVPTSSVYRDENNIASPVLDGGYKVLISPSSTTQGFKNKLSENKFAFLFGALDPNIASGLKTNIIGLDSGFKTESLGSTKFVKVNNSSGGIRASHKEQWLWMKGAIEGAKETNIVLMLPKSIYSFKDKMEQDLFLKLIQEYSDSGKNMHVVYGGYKTAVTTSNGVKYFEINPGQGGNGFEFVVNGDRVTYVRK